MHNDRFTGTFTTALAELDWACTPGAEPEVTAVRLLGLDGWEPCQEGMMPLLRENSAFMADLRLLVGPAPEPEPELDPCP